MKIFEDNKPTPKNLFERLRAEDAQYKKWDTDEKDAETAPTAPQKKYGIIGNKKDISLLILAAAVVFLIVIGFFISSFKQSSVFSKLKNSPIGKTKILVNDLTVYVDIANTPSEWQLGLSGRKGLKKNEGLLFVSDKKTVPTFWMKDMLFPIDIIWIVDGEIIQIDQNLPKPKKDTPDGELKFYKPLVPIEYVLEVNAGFVEKHEIAVRDKVDLSEVE